MSPVSRALAQLAAALWLAAPVIVGGLAHIAVMRRGGFATLAAIPIDGGATVRGRRVFGDNKTLRGVVLLILFSALAAEAQAWLVMHASWARAVSVAGTAVLPAWAWGALLATGVALVSSGSMLAKIFGFLALIMASINIFGGFLVTQRMLAMYKKKEKK